MLQLVELQIKYSNCTRAQICKLYSEIGNSFQAWSGDSFFFSILQVIAMRVIFAK